jgi:ABC-2 type transport system permease protein
MSMGTIICNKYREFRKKLFTKQEAPDAAGTGKYGLKALYYKELADHFRSKRFIIILLIVAITGLASIYSASLGIRDAVEKNSGDFVFLRLFTSSGSSMPSFVSFVSFLGPLIGLALGFDAINGEQARGTLSRLLSQPIHRDSVINGKFLAGVTILSLMMIYMGLAVGGIGITLIGVPPSLEEFIRILLFVFFTVIYMALWLSVSMLFSILFKQTATSALSGIAVWLFFAIFMNLLAGAIAGAIFPVNDQSAISELLRNQRFQQYLNRLSPTMLYSEAVVTILNPGVRTLGPIISEQLEGAIPGALPLGQSMLLVWPHLIGLLAVTTICFTISYIIFMRREIRA